MELARRPETRKGFSPEFKRKFVAKIVVMDKALGGLAEELGIPPRSCASGP
jgi:transposase-like protein